MKEEKIYLSLLEKNYTRLLNIERLYEEFIIAEKALFGYQTMLGGLWDIRKKIKIPRTSEMCWKSLNLKWKKKFISII